MLSTPSQHSRQALAHMTPQQEAALLAQARELQQAAAAGKPLPLLRGRNIALMSESGEGAAALFRRAMTELGAHVAHIRSNLSELGTSAELSHTGRMLGRLYDAVECQSMAPEVVRQVADAARVPVFDGIAMPDHPVARLAAVLGGEGTMEDHRRFVVQAVLVGCLR